MIEIMIVIMTMISAETIGVLTKNDTKETPPIAEKNPEKNPVATSENPEKPVNLVKDVRKI